MLMGALLLPHSAQEPSYNEISFAPKRWKVRASPAAVIPDPQLVIIGLERSTPASPVKVANAFRGLKKPSEVFRLPNGRDRLCGIWPDLSPALGSGEVPSNRPEGLASTV